MARAPKAAPQPEAAPAPRISPRPAALSLDVGEALSKPPPNEDVPWAAAEAAGAHASEPKIVARAPESLDPDLPPPAPEAKTAGEHPMWSADPFTATPGEEPQTLTAEEAGLVEAEPEAKQPDLVEIAAAAEEKASSASKGDFSFAGLLHEAHAAPEPPKEERPALAQDYPDTTTPGGPSEELLATARGEREPPQFPGDEPTRIEPVSAALLDKLRERDDEPQPEPQQGWGSLVPESPGAALDEPAPAPEATVTMQDFSMPTVPAEDPDEQHWRETFDKFKELKAQLGEASDKISFEKFATKLRKNRTDLLAKHNCKGVRFSVYEKDGKAAIKASAIR
jgi:hypothetical protein